MDKIIVFQTWGIGDMIMTTPMLTALRRKLPKAWITVIVANTASAEVIRNSFLCNEIRVLLYKKLNVYKLIKVFCALRKEGFELAIICSGISRRFGQLLYLFSKVPAFSLCKSVYSVFG